MSKTVSLSLLEMAVLDKIFQIQAVARGNVSAKVHRFEKVLRNWKQGLRKEAMANIIMPDTVRSFVMKKTHPTLKLCITGAFVMIEDYIFAPDNYGKPRVVPQGVL